MLTERAGRQSCAPCERHPPISTSKRHRQAAKERRGVYLWLHLSVYLAIHSIILSSFCPSVCIHLLLSDKKKSVTHTSSLRLIRLLHSDVSRRKEAPAKPRRSSTIIPFTVFFFRLRPESFFPPSFFFVSSNAKCQIIIVQSVDLLCARDLTAPSIRAITSPLAAMIRRLTGPVMNFSQIKVGATLYVESHPPEEGGAADTLEPAVH